METTVVEASFMKRLHASRPHSQMGRPRTYLSGILFLSKIEVAGYDGK